MRRIWIRRLALAACAAALTSCSQEQASQVEERTYAMGEKANVGTLTYTVFDRQWLTQLGNGLDARLPQNRFYQVRISAANSGTTDAPIPALSLVDDAGNQYLELNNGEGVQGWLGYLRHAPPGQTVTGNLLFDVAPKHYRLKVTDGAGDRTAFVEMPLSFDSEAPDSQQPGAASALTPDAGATPPAAPPTKGPIRKQ